MSDGTRSRDDSVPAAAPAGVEDIAARLRRGRGNYNAGVYLGYDRLLFRLNRNGELEHLLEAVEEHVGIHDYVATMKGVSCKVCEAYRRLLENVSDER